FGLFDDHLLSLHFSDGFGGLYKLLEIGVGLGHVLSARLQAIVRPVNSRLLFRSFSVESVLSPGCSPLLSSASLGGFMRSVVGCFLRPCYFFRIDRAAGYCRRQ